MLKTIALIMMFQDGYMGGHSTFAYFKTKAECTAQGEKSSLQYAAWGHPATFVCAKVSDKAAPKPSTEPPKVTIFNPGSVTP